MAHQIIPWTSSLKDQSFKFLKIQATATGPITRGVKTGSSRLGTDERGKCDNVGLSAACPSNEATICSVVVAVA